MTGFRLVALLAAAVLAAAAAALFAWWARVSRLPAYDRPAVTWHPRFRTAFAALCVTLCAASLGAAFVAHPVAGIAAALLGAAAVGLVAARRSETLRARILRARFARFARRARHATGAAADQDPRTVRVEFLRALHPEWGPDLAEQIANDCAEPETLARWIARVERHALVRRRG